MRFTIASIIVLASAADAGSHKSLLRTRKAKIVRGTNPFHGRTLEAQDLRGQSTRTYATADIVLVNSEEEMYVKEIEAEQEAEWLTSVEVEPLPVDKVDEASEGQVAEAVTPEVAPAEEPVDGSEVSEPEPLVDGAPIDPVPVDQVDSPPVDVDESSSGGRGQAVSSVKGSTGEAGGTRKSGRDRGVSR